MGFLQPASPYQSRDIDSAEEGPGPAVMIVMRLVEIAHAIIFAPVLLARLDRGIQGTDGKGIAQSTAVNVIQNFVCLYLVSHAEQDRQQVTQGIKAIGIIAESHVGQVKGALDQFRFDAS